MVFIIVAMIHGFCTTWGRNAGISAYFCTLSADLRPLYDKTLETICVSIDQLQRGWPSDPISWMLTWGHKESTPKARHGWAFTNFSWSPPRPLATSNTSNWRAFGILGETSALKQCHVSVGKIWNKWGRKLVILVILLANEIIWSSSS